jgi:hypothetical protein
MLRVIDTDSHAVEAPDLWTSRMSKKKWGDAIPHVKRVPELDSDVWFVGDVPVMAVGFSVIEKDEVGVVKRNEENFPNFLTKVSDFHASAWDPHERAKVMQEYGVDRAALYPNLPRTGRSARTTCSLKPTFRIPHAWSATRSSARSTSSRAISPTRIGTRSCGRTPSRYSNSTTDSLFGSAQSGGPMFATARKNRPA